MTKLKPCPFCGGEAEIKYIGNEHTKSRSAQIKCKTWGCGIKKTVSAMRFNIDWCEEKVIKAWNRRAK